MVKERADAGTRQVAISLPLIALRLTFPFTKVTSNATLISEPAKTTPVKQSFGQAFKSAKDGSTFEWNGKQYKKEYATESTPSSTTKSDAPKTSANNTSVQTLAEQIVDLNKRIDDPKVSEQDKKNFEYAREALRKQMVANASRTK